MILLNPVSKRENYVQAKKLATIRISHGSFGKSSVAHMDKVLSGKRDSKKDLLKRVLHIKEAVIQTVYRDQDGTSHFKPFLDLVRMFKGMIKFSLSSLFCAVIDIGLFTLIFKLLSVNAISWSLFGATSIARLVSAVANFAINKKVVFESRDSVFTQATKYFMLCAVQMIFSWLILQGLTSLSNEHVVLLKISTDIFLFCISFLVQRVFIFGRQIYHEKIA